MGREKNEEKKGKEEIYVIGWENDMSSVVGVYKKDNLLSALPVGVLRGSQKVIRVEYNDEVEVGEVMRYGSYTNKEYRGYGLYKKATGKYIDDFIRYYVEVVDSEDVTLEYVERLVLTGVDIDVESSKGLTLLHIAAAYDDVELVKKLIELGADINKVSGEGWTALHYGVFSANLEIVRILVEAGADREVGIEGGELTAYKLATEVIKGRELRKEMFELLYIK